MSYPNTIYVRFLAELNAAHVRETPFDGAVKYVAADQVPPKPQAPSEPDADGWHTHNGGPCPVAGDVWVEVWLRDDDRADDNAEAFEWVWGRDSQNIWDIIKWRYAR